MKLYGIKCWTVKMQQHSIAEMRMLELGLIALEIVRITPFVEGGKGWISIWEVWACVEVSCRFRIKKVDQMEGRSIARYRIPTKTIEETVNKT
jgi:hypothetical protein